MKSIDVSVTALLIAFATNPASADSLTKTVAVGTKLQVGSYYSIHEDCTSLGETTVRVMNQPNHGVVTIHKGRDYASFPPSNPRSACNTRKVPAMLVEYKPENNYIGSDYFVLNVIYSDGFEKERSFTINVK